MNKDDLNEFVKEIIPKLDEFEKGFYKDAGALIGTDKANILLMARDVAYLKGVADCLTDNNASMATNFVAALIRVQTLKDKEDE